MPSHKRADSSENSSENKQEKEKAVNKEADEEKKLNENDAEFTIQLDDDDDEVNDGTEEKIRKTEEDDAERSRSTPPAEEEKVQESTTDETEDVKNNENHKESQDGTEVKDVGEEMQEEFGIKESRHDSAESTETAVAEMALAETAVEETAVAETVVAETAVAETAVAQTAVADTETTRSRESSKTPVPLNASPEEPATGEVVEEAPLSVKEQIAAFSKLRLQETHGKPKPGVASAFSPKPASQQAPAQKTAPPPEEALAPRPQSNQLFENAQPKPFYAALEKPATPAEVSRVDDVAPNITKTRTTTMMATTAKTTDFGAAEVPVPGNQQQHQRFNGERKPSYEAPPPVQKLAHQQQHTSSTKWTPMVAKAEAPTPSKLAPFGSTYRESRFMQASEEKQQATPNKYVGPEIVSRAAGPSQLVRLRRENSEMNWGFAVFGGADFGCPPIAGKAGLEVGDIIVSICNSPVQGKQHSEIKAEILRAGNELDFMIIKQGIDKTVLSKKVPEVLQPAAPIEAQSWQRETRISTDIYRTTNKQQQQQQYPSSRASITGSSPYRPIRTHSLRLLEEYLANRSMRPKTEPTIRVYTTPAYQAEPSSSTEYTSDYYTTSTVIRTNRKNSASLSPNPQPVTYISQPTYQQRPLSPGRPEAVSPRPYFASTAQPVQTVKYISAVPSPRGTVFTGSPHDSLTSQVYYNNGNTVARTQPLRVTTMSTSFQPQQQQHQQVYNYTETSEQVYSRPTYYKSAIENIDTMVEFYIESNHE
ncbi:unnamed protein product [Schistocephalus solidus]|uniref:PDZ domain-containing protein n=1 Tax=Schistocephalus solidus TaxID=70667 RepID=A0A183T3X8_SCHSO|nr:unnamed protein product [Schistocephalus solidus]